ncbi:MAG TPA: phosphoribosyltransferase family protein [Candidatus Nanoarchaeia archaeon]|nr:phosphoribosyltransferase family protein [Candidatus Nanoarchaeia archaeon]
MAFITHDFQGRALEKNLREHFPVLQHRFLGEYQERIAGVLISAEELEQGIADAARIIAQQYLDKGIDRVVAMYVLKGAREFYGEMKKYLFEFGLRTIEDTIGVSRYEKGLQGGIPRISVPETEARPGDHILIIEDIVDEGFTLEYIANHLRVRKPASIKVCSLLMKPSKYKATVGIDFPLFHIDDHWVVGKGMDLTDKERSDSGEEKERSIYRDLPFVGVANPDFLLRSDQINAEKVAHLQSLITYAH